MHQETKYVCVNCFSDPGLVTFIQEHAEAYHCSFCNCNVSHSIAASIDVVSEYFLSCLFKEYDFPEHHLAWDKEEGAWIGHYWDTYDLVLYELELEFPQHNIEVLLPSLLGDHIHQLWCEVGGYGPNDEEWAAFSWTAFCEVVMHRRRFFFMDVGHDPDGAEVYSPREVLGTIFDYAQEMDLFVEIGHGTALFRARQEGWRQRWESAEQLGPPPAEKATQANRMSPAGITMFYGSDDEITALKEIEKRPGWYALGRFETLRSSVLLDLVELPPLPSLFESTSDGAEVPPRRILKFLRHVAKHMSWRIDGDDRIHVDYVPTQVVTEFIRDQVTWEGYRIDGIRYPSSVRKGHASYVLFANENNVVSTETPRPSEDRWIQLSTPPSHKWSWACTKGRPSALEGFRKVASLWLSPSPK